MSCFENSSLFLFCCKNYSCSQVKFYINRVICMPLVPQWLVWFRHQLACSGKLSCHCPRKGSTNSHLCLLCCLAYVLTVHGCMHLWANCALQSHQGVQHGWNCISIYLPSTLFSVLLLSSSLLLFFPLTDAKVVINYEKKSHRELTLHVGEVITDVKLVCVWWNQHIDVKIFHLTQAKNVCFSGIKLLMQHSVHNLNTG